MKNAYQRKAEELLSSAQAVLELNHNDYGTMRADAYTKIAEAFLKLHESTKHQKP
jgi:hypothetical protein